MKNYLNFEGLSYFLSKLLNKFSIIGHTHTFDEVEIYIISNEEIDEICGGLIEYAEDARF